MAAHEEEPHAEEEPAKPTPYQWPPESDAWKVRRYGRRGVDQAQAAGQDIGERMEETPTHVHLRQTAAQRDTMRASAQADPSPAARRAIGRLDAPRVWG